MSPSSVAAGAIRVPRVTYVSWAPHCSRSDHTARELGGTSHMVYWEWLGSHPATVWLKYLGQTLSTWRLLWRERPDAVFVMSPPPTAIPSVYVYCRLRRIPFVVDAHSGVFLTDRWRHFQGFQFWFLRRAATTIVTNEYLAERVRSHGGHATVAADVPVAFGAAGDGAPAVPFTAVFVTSFDRDEPIAEMVRAAALAPDVPFLMTGDSPRAAQLLPAALPPNLTRTGFVDTSTYGTILRQAGVVIALTSDAHTTQRGAFEAIYQGTPVIVSDTALLREEFDSGAVHVANQAAAIAGAVRAVRQDLAGFRIGAERLRARKTARWGETRTALLAAIGGAARPEVRA